MKKELAAVTIISLLLLVVLTSVYQVDIDQREEILPDFDVQWMTFEQALEKSKVEKRKIFVDVYTDWCGWCKVMDKKTFSEANVASLLNEKYYAVKFNAEQTEDVLFQDHTFKFVPQGKRGYHELAAALLQNKLSYPTVVFLDEDFNLIQPLPGYREPKEFYPILKFFSEDSYKTMKWDDFRKTYESPYN